MWVKLWGVRGSTPTPQIENLAYGGNTSCVEVRSENGDILIIDAGSGIRNLGQSLLEEFKERMHPLHIFLSHYHWDHIQGIPFFLPLYNPDNEVSFYAPCALGPLQERLQGQMSRPYFPVSLDVCSHNNFVEFDSAPLHIGSATLHPFPMNHPQGAYGYRIESDGKVLVYASDLEHGHPQLDAVVRDHAQNADILIYDAQYTPEEYEKHRGWGHSTWKEATRLAKETNVKHLILYHHDPWHSDQFMLDVVRQARDHFENTMAAAEGWVAEL